MSSVWGSIHSRTLGIGPDGRVRNLLAVMAWNLGSLLGSCGG